MQSRSKLSSSLTILGLLVMSLCTSFETRANDLELIRFKNRLVKLARAKTDRLIDRVRLENGKGLLGEQMADAFDIYMAMSMQEISNKLIDGKPAEKTKLILWLDARPESGISQLTQWIGEIEGAPDSSHINQPASSIDINRVLQIVKHKFLVLDDIFEKTDDPFLIDSLIFNLRELGPPDATVIIIDQKRLKSKLLPTTLIRIEYVSLYEESCDEQLTSK